VEGIAFAEDNLRSQFVGRDVRLFIASSETDYYSAGIQAKEYDGLTATGLSLGGERMPKPCI